jgi:hypothetical protein
MMNKLKLISALFVILFLGSSKIFGQLDGARVYWPLPKNTNILAVHYVSGTMNATWNNFELVQPSINIQNNLYMLTYTRVQPILGRTAYWTVMLPAAQIETNTSLPVPELLQLGKGLADPGLSATINLFGAPGMRAKDFIRYDLTTTINFGVKATFPLGTYDPDEMLNVGSNQYKIRFSLPMVHAFSFWAPGERFVLDVMPTATLITKNNNNMGNEIEQDPLFVIESHLSHDVTKRAFLSLDYSYIFGGKATYTDKETGMIVKTTDDFDTHLLGVTANFEINDHMQLFLTHAQTFSKPGDISLEGSLLKATLTWSWHDYFEKVNDFHGD